MLVGKDDSRHSISAAASADFYATLAAFASRTAAPPAAPQQRGDGLEEGADHAALSAKLLVTVCAV